MRDAGVDRQLIRASLKELDPTKVLPFRFISAARYAPDFQRELEDAMFRSMDGTYRLNGVTTVLVDVSGCMDERVSSKSEVTRMDAGSGLAILLRELAEEVNVRTFSNSNVPVEKRYRGFALRDAIVTSQPHGGTYLGAAVQQVLDNCSQDRLVVITDEQSHDPVPTNLNGAGNAYLINVAQQQAWRRLQG